MKLPSRHVPVSFLFSLLVASSLIAGPATVAGLRCDYAENPLGIDVPHPGLSWIIQSDRRGESQSAFQVLVASRAELLDAGKGDIWDTGKVASDRSVGVRYEGKPLQSRQRCYWKVRIWDRDGNVTPYSAPAWWESGLLNPADWKASWIGFTPGWNGRALYFRSFFEVAKPVERARIYAAGLGYYELRLNGNKVGDRVLEPANTDYSKRILYATYDVTGDLKQGRNALGAIAGHGWYGMPKMLLQMEITYKDGSTQAVYTAPRPEQTWQVTSGPIVMDSIYDGETYDARLEKPDWDNVPAGPAAKPADRHENWITLHPVEPPGGRLVAAKLEPIRVVETRRAASVKQPRPDVFVFDAGQNLAGWARIRVKGPRGARVTLKFSEHIYPDGAVNQENLRQALATDTYILKGGEVETWEPRFTYHGFRYVQVEGFPGTPSLEDVDIRVVRSAVEPAGDFKSGNDLLNRIHKMVWWTEASNLHSVPTDCPQRDERMGWMNDLTVRMEMALYNFDLARFYAKFIDDVQDTQSAGAIACTAPFKYGRRPADPVSASYLLLAWNLYQHYGDTLTMAEHFDGLKAWVDFLASRTENGIVDYSYYGDWSPPQAFSVNGSAVSQFTPGKLMSTGYLYYGAVLLQRMADVLGRTEDVSRYRGLAQKTAAAFNREYWNAAAGGYASNNQASNSFALFLGLVPPDQVKRVVDNLAKDVEKQGFHLTTGNLCTKYVLEMLTEHGHADLAYRIATQETYPSWGFMLANGATTLWERWEQLTGGGMNSGNHPMMGSVGSWFYKYLAGIRVDPAGPGFKKILIRPYMPAGLDRAEASYKSVYGEIRSAWRREGGRVSLEVRIPANASATVTVPVAQGQSLKEGGQPVEKQPSIRVLEKSGGFVVLSVGSGDYRFTTE